MELQSDRQEIAVRLLQNGRYVWSITTNASTNEPMQVQIERLKQLDGTLRDAFPNHVKESSTRFKEFEE